jgi:hypothetical protein
MRILMALLLSFLGVPAMAQVCSIPEAKAAETISSSLKSWSAIHRAYQQYGHCDDGAISEGFSQSVVHLLASKWHTLPRAQRIIAKDPTFQDFIVRHVDSTADGAEVKLVGTFASHKCPVSASDLCKQLVRAARDQ